jgi:hypothetical protein
MQNEPTLPSQTPRFPPPVPQGDNRSAAQNAFAQLCGLPRRTQAIVGGCAGAIVLCCCIAAAAASSPGSQTGASSPTATATTQSVLVSDATATTGPIATATAALTPKSKPKPTATDTVIAQPTCIPGAVNCNPWGYNFSPGTVITDPPAAFCSYFDCINNFSNGLGYVVQCGDLRYSKSGGRSGVCSQHGGYKRTLYSH